MRPLLVCTHDLKGGAARASFRFHKALVSQNVDSFMLVANKDSDDWRVTGIKGYPRKLIHLFCTVLEEQVVKLQKTNNPVFHSPAKLSSFKARRFNMKDADIVHLNWVGKTGLSIEEISKITKPVVWTFHDMWAFCGAEHYADDNKNSRWRLGYARDNKAPQSGLDIDRWVWKRKQKAWAKPFHIVTPSHWLADCVRESALMHNWPVSVIPNLLDVCVFKPTNKILAREILGLPTDKRIILFGALGGSADPRKGWDLLQAALSKLGKNHFGLQAVIFGESQPQTAPDINMPIHWVGHLHDDVTLALLYSAADVMVVPSRQEAFGQTASEAHACGCPVVAFDATGLRDIIEHKKTGYLAKPFNTVDLANGITWIMTEPNRHQQLSVAARKRAIENWSPDIVIPQYFDVYHKAIKSQKNRN